MKTMKNAIALFLVAALLLTAAPLDGFAGLPLPEIKLQNLFSQFDIVDWFTVKASAATTGTCGENLTWTLDDDGTLIISGTNAMNGLNFSDSPWNGLNIVNVIVQEGVTSISASAFRNCATLTSVTIPATVKSIGANAFYNCNLLQEVIFAERSGDQTIEIGNYAFKYCTALEKINLQDSNAITIGYGTFDGCSKLQRIELAENTTTVGELAFENCTALTSVDLKNVQEVGYRAFNNSGLTSVCIPATVNTIGYSAFSTSKLQSVVFAEGSTLTTIGSSAFSGTSIEKIIIPATVNTINSSAFRNCKMLKEVVFEDRTNEQVLVLEDYAFEYCTLLEKINLQDSNIISVGYKSFCGCSNLQSVVLANNTKAVESIAFEDCTSLTSIDLKNVQTIGYRAFKNSGLQSISIPADVTSIGFSAFAYCNLLETVFFEPRTDSQMLAVGNTVFRSCMALRWINLENSNATQLGSNAFTDCIELKNISLPVTLLKIGANCFDKCENLTIHMDEIVPAIVTTVIDEGWKFDVADLEIKDNEIRNLSSQGISYAITQNNAANKNSVSLSVGYDFKDNVKDNISDCRLVIKLSANAVFNTGEVYVNGEKWTAVSIKNNTILYVDNVPTSAIVEYKVVPFGTGVFASYAKIDYTLDEKSHSELIGVIDSARELITINTPSETKNNEVVVSGFTFPENEVELYVNNTCISTIVASKTGAYSTTVVLPVSQAEEKFVVEAKINNGKNTASTTVLYSADAAVITSAEMIYKGKRYDLLANQGKLPVISWSHGSFSFVIKVDNPSVVEAIYVVDQKNGTNNSLRCEYNTEREAFVGTGFKNQLINNVKILCISKNNKDELFANINLNEISSEFKESIVPEDFEIRVEKNTLAENPGNGEAILQLMNQDTQVGEIKLQTVPVENITPEDLLANGYEMYPHNEKVNRYVKTILWEDGTFEKIVFFEELGEIGYKTLEVISGCVDIYNSVVEFFGEDGIDFYFKGKDVASAVCEYFFDKVDFGPILYDLACTGLEVNKDELTKLYGKIGGLYGGFAVTVFDLVFKEYDSTEERNVDIAFALMYGVGFVVALAFPELFIPISMTISFIDLLCSLENIGFFDNSFRFIIDPSGVVYEAVPSNTVADATVTAMWIPYDSSVVDFWDAGYPDLSKAVVWNAEEYDQVNPLVTDADGWYSWDVPQGWWIIKCEKDGYETTYSEWMEIPPEHFNVNIGLQTTVAPTVEYVNAYENEIEIVFSQYMDITSFTEDSITLLQNDVELNCTITPVNAETTGDGSTVYADTFCVVPAVPLNGTVHIEVEPVRNYCAIEMAEKYVVELTITPKITQLLVPETVNATLNSASELTISAYPAEAANGKKVIVSCSNSIIAELANTEVVLDENGCATVEIMTLLPGDVTISFTIENTTYSSDTTLVVYPDAHEQPEDTYTITWLADDTLIRQDVLAVGDAIIVPASPVKTGYVFNGWIPEVPAVMPAYDLIIKASFSAETVPEYILADIDGDGIISSSDARLALRASVGLETLSEEQVLAADVNNDGEVTSADARLILRASVGLEEL